MSEDPDGDIRRIELNSSDDASKPVWAAAGELKFRFALVDGEMLTWKADHWEDAGGNTVHLSYPTESEDSK